MEDDRDGVEFLLSERGEEEFPGVGLEVHVRPGEMSEWWLWEGGRTGERSAPHNRFLSWYLSHTLIRPPSITRYKWLLTRLTVRRLQTSGTDGRVWGNCLNWHQTYIWFHLLVGGYEREKWDEIFYPFFCFQFFSFLVFEFHTVCSFGAFSTLLLTYVMTKEI